MGAGLKISVSRMPYVIERLVEWGGGGGGLVFTSIRTGVMCFPLGSHQVNVRERHSHESSVHTLHSITDYVKI